MIYNIYCKNHHLSEMKSGKKSCRFLKKTLVVSKRRKHFFVIRLVKKTFFFKILGVSAIFTAAYWCLVAMRTDWSKISAMVHLIEILEIRVEVPRYRYIFMIFIGLDALTFLLIILKLKPSDKIKNSTRVSLSL